ncbi:MAG: ABC transporter permease [Gemmatimonadales bacterium]|nr:ABC transporter permease [Gemmatimonadales bacterium]
MQGFITDLRHSVAGLRRNPWLALTAVVALAMGIGFTTTMFSIVRGGTRSLPFDQPDELVAVSMVSVVRGGDREIWPEGHEYLDWSRRQRSFEGLGAYQATQANLSGDADRPERRPATYVTANTFVLLGARPLLGRTLAPADETPGAPDVVLLGYDLWRTRFALDSQIVGRVIRVDSRPATVIGVMPPQFGFPINSHLWLPLPLDPAVLIGNQVQVFGRLRDGVSSERAAAELTTMLARAPAVSAGTPADRRGKVIPFIETETPREMVSALYLMVGAVSFVLLIACANVANLLLARAANRSRDTAIRTALGATRRRLVTQHLVEAVLLSGIGGLIGLGIAHAGVRFFALMSGEILEAFWVDFRVDGVVVVFASLLVMFAAVAAGILPALRASATDVAEVLKDQSAGSTGLRMGRLARALVVGEVALATGFLITTVTFVKSAVALRAVDLPFPAKQIFTAQLGMSQELLADPERRARFAADLSARLRAIPGAEAVALVSSLPGRGSVTWNFALDGAVFPRPEERPYTNVVTVTPDFLDVLGATAVRGRSLSWRDAIGTPAVAMVNESFVRRHSADRDPLGRRLTLGEREFTVVGVVPDLLVRDVDQPLQDGVYLSLLQARAYQTRILIRTAGAPLALSASVWEAVRAVDPDLPIQEIASLQEAIFADSKVLDAMAALFLAFGVGALFLTVIGLYGIVAFAVSRRTREIGVRVALGARPRDVVALVLKQGAREVGLGTAIGLAIAFALAKALSAAIEVVDPADPGVYVAVVSLLLTAALAGLLVPVRRALRLNPSRALGAE